MFSLFRYMSNKPVNCYYLSQIDALTLASGAPKSGATIPDSHFRFFPPLFGVTCKPMLERQHDPFSKMAFLSMFKPPRPNLFKTLITNLNAPLRFLSDVIRHSQEIIGREFRSSTVVMGCLASSALTFLNMMDPHTFS
jgi:hypothetical protein